MIAACKGCGGPYERRSNAHTYCKPDCRRRWVDSRIRAVDLFGLVPVRTFREIALELGLSHATVQAVFATGVRKLRKRAVELGLRASER